MTIKMTDKAFIGAFFAGAVVLVVAAVFIFGSGTFFAEKNLFVLFFKGSVQGLNVGSPVVLRGVKIGSVKDIKINAGSFSQSFSIPVYIEVRKDCIVMEGEGGADITMESNLDYFIKQGLRGQLETQSMVTGQLLISLDFHPGTRAGFSGIKSEFPEIPTISSDIEELTRKIKQVPIEEIFNKLLSVITSIEAAFNSDMAGEMLYSLGVMMENTADLVKNINIILPDLAENMEMLLQDMQEMAGNTDSQIVSAGEEIQKAIADVRILLRKATQQVSNIGSGMDQTFVEAQKLMAGIRSDAGPVWKSAREAAGAAGDASRQMKNTLKKIDGLTGQDSVLMFNLNSTLNEISDAARSLRLLTEYLERHPEALIQGKK